MLIYNRKKEAPVKAETAHQQMILLFPYDNRIKQYRTEVMVHDQVGHTLDERKRSETERYNL